ncbi:MAG: FAD-binding oxidoreductase, partial [Bacilli bacterium]|nr:FAD-binding oxidoreductase [Bacilli bacterium]
MSNKPYKGFSPKWVETPADPRSWRSIFRWGDPHYFKWPKENLYKVMKEIFDLTDDDFQKYDGGLGFGPVDYNVPSCLAPEHIDAFKALLGEEFVRTDSYSRLSVAYGKTMHDVLRLRQKIVENIPDAVLYPDNREQIEKVVAYCSTHKIP